MMPFVFVSVISVKTSTSAQISLLLLCFLHVNQVVLVSSDALNHLSNTSPSICASLRYTQHLSVMLPLSVVLQSIHQFSYIGMLLLY